MAFWPGAPFDCHSSGPPRVLLCDPSEDLSVDLSSLLSERRSCGTVGDGFNHFSAWKYRYLAIDQSLAVALALIRRVAALRAESTKAKKKVGPGRWVLHSYQCQSIAESSGIGLALLLLGNMALGFLLKAARPAPFLLFIFLSIRCRLSAGRTLSCCLSGCRVVGTSRPKIGRDRPRGQWTVHRSEQRSSAGLKGNKHIFCPPGINERP